MRRTTTTARWDTPLVGFTVNLKDLLWEYEGAHGVTKLVVMAKLRDYVTRQDMWTVIDEIKTITEEKYLDVLIGVGMRGPLWSAVVAQKALLMGVS